MIAGSTPVINPATGPWRAEYFNNASLSGSPALVRDEGQPNYSWGYGSPAPGVIANDFFSARWTRTMDMMAGRYRFVVTTDDGVRLWVNNQLIINGWRNQAALTQSAEIDLVGGPVPIRMEYYEADVLAEARLSWQRVGVSANTGGAPLASVKSNYLNVRQGPGTNYGVLSQLARGQMVQLAGFRNHDASWVKVVLPDGRQGWCYSGYLQASIPLSSLVLENSLPQPVGDKKATVTNANYVNVRSGPGVANKIITALPRGTSVELLGRNSSTTWAKVQLASGVTGWMNAHYLSSVTPINSLSITH